MRNKIISLSALFIALLIFTGSILSRKPAIFLVGDSTMADKPLVDNPERGWGQLLHLFFSDEVTIENHARNGRSTKSFIDQGRWHTVIDRVRPGDFIVIQFGHNDAKKDDTARYADAHTAYRTNLIRMVRETKEHGAYPLLLTPVNRRKFDTTGTWIDTHGDYPAVMREVAAEENVPLIDMHKKTAAFLNTVGPLRSKNLFLWINPGEYKALPEGKKDDTHFVYEGAKIMAGLVVEGLRELEHPLAHFLIPSAVPSAGNGKRVALDYFYNNERKSDKILGRIRYHYVWDDTTNSGFSELGKMICDEGAMIDTISVRPTKELLAKASIYIIVDPDTPQETESPNYLDNEAATEIVDWVKSGGILLLMGNDKGNAEFEHFNLLAERFGIHFVDTSRNRVQAKDFEMGAFSVFPDHPLFTGVKKIYLKEISTFRLTEPAVPLYTDHGDVIMAVSTVGKGMVFAVGDPWLYNEYYDCRKLPTDFENVKAAKNLFRWLLSIAAKPDLPKR